MTPMPSSSRRIPPNDRFHPSVGRGSSQHGLRGGITTYNEITLGATFKVPIFKPFENFLIRPEVRWDTSLSDTHPFDDGTDRNQFTFGIDGILSF